MSESTVRKMRFAPISKQSATEMVVAKHYLHRPCPISWAWGVFVDGQLHGVLTIGKPCSWSLCEGVCGAEKSKHVYELNRLWLHDSLPRNAESKFIGWCLRQIRKEYPNLILVSYADTLFGHVGTVYQSVSWIYTGTSAPFRDRTLKGTIERSLKHRYVWFANPDDRLLLRWSEQPYPKAERKTA